MSEHGQPPADGESAEDHETEARSPVEPRSDAAADDTVPGLQSDRLDHDRTAGAQEAEQPPRTGDPAVDTALAAAAAVQDRDPVEQLETYVGTHRALQDRLADSGA